MCNDRLLIFKIIIDNNNYYYKLLLIMYCNDYTRAIALNIVLFNHSYYHEMNKKEYLNFRKKKNKCFSKNVVQEIKINKVFDLWINYNKHFKYKKPINYLNDNYKCIIGQSFNDKVFAYKYHINMVLSSINIIEHKNKHNYDKNVEQIYRINCLLNTCNRNILRRICNHFNISKSNFLVELQDVNIDINHLKQFILAELKAKLLFNFHKTKYENNIEWLNRDYYGKTIIYSSYETYSTNNDKYAKGRLMEITPDYFHLYNKNKVVDEQNIFINKTSQYRFHIIDNLYDEFIDECANLKIVNEIFEHPFINVIQKWDNIGVWFE